MPIKQGAQVRQVTPAIQGEVTQRRFNESHECMEYLVSFNDADGTPSERWFLENQIAELPAEEVPA